MQPVTPAEKIRAFVRAKGCLDSLCFDGVLNNEEFVMLINRCVDIFGHPIENEKLMEINKCTDRHNGEAST